MCVYVYTQHIILFIYVCICIHTTHIILTNTTDVKQSISVHVNTHTHTHIYTHARAHIILTNTTDVKQPISTWSASFGWIAHSTGKFKSGNSFFRGPWASRRSPSTAHLCVFMCVYVCVCVYMSSATASLEGPEPVGGVHPPPTCVCVYIYIYIHTYIYIYTHTYAYTHQHTYVSQIDLLRKGLLLLTDEECVYTCMHTYM